MDALAPREQRLEVLSVAIASPGSWAFLGALNPLKAMNDFIDRRHERKKDHAYRNDAERERLSLENRRRSIENELLENQVVQQRIAIAGELGIPLEDQRNLLNRFAVRPLLELEQVVEGGMAFPGWALPEVQRAEQRASEEEPPTAAPPELA